MRLHECLKRKKGISFQRPDASLADSYLAKAETTLAEAGKLKDNSWKVVLLYYAAYFSTYSLLARCGIKSEIHACTFAALERTMLLTPEEIARLRQAADDRVLLQYYVENGVTDGLVDELHAFARDMLVTCRNIRLTEKDVSDIRRLLQSI